MLLHKGEGVCVQGEQGPERSEPGGQLSGGQMAEGPPVGPLSRQRKLPLPRSQRGGNASTFGKNPRERGEPGGPRLALRPEEGASVWEQVLICRAGREEAVDG